MYGLLKALHPNLFNLCLFGGLCLPVRRVLEKRSPGPIIMVSAKENSASLASSCLSSYLSLLKMDWVPGAHLLSVRREGGHVPLGPDYLGSE